MVKIKKMNRRDSVALAILVALAVILGLLMLLYGSNFAVLNPKGVIAFKERGLILFAAFLGLLVILPVFIMTGYIAWKYRESNHRAKYSPDWDHNLAVESIWWGVPLLIITILSVVTWKSSYALDPFKQLSSANRPLTIQVVALQWKWLFIYPQQNIASVNYVKFPAQTPITFEITSDAPMNSFWLPQLSGQMYAMNGMSTQLNIMADSLGTFNGSSANISGKGFAGMKFSAESSTQADFNDWVNEAKQSPSSLDLRSYNHLASPSTNNQVAYYKLTQPALYNIVVEKFMDPNYLADGGTSL